VQVQVEVAGAPSHRIRNAPGSVEKVPIGNTKTLQKHPPQRGPREERLGRRQASEHSVRRRELLHAARKAAGERVDQRGVTCRAGRRGQEKGGGAARVTKSRLQASLQNAAWKVCACVKREGGCVCRA